MDMHVKLRLFALGIAAALLATSSAAFALDRTLAVLDGLAPFGELLSTPQGRAALAANHRVTYEVQSGTNGQPLLLPYAQQQQQALWDAFITGETAYNLADGLGSGLGDAYRTIFAYKSTDDGLTYKVTGSLPRVQVLISAAMGESSADAGAAKFIFANGGVASGVCSAAVVDGSDEVLKQPGFQVDVYGKAYGIRGVGPGVSSGADPCGDSRPYQTDYRIVMFPGDDFWGVRSGNPFYLDGPIQDLRTSPAFPSGHTTYAYTEAVLLGVLQPQRYSQMVTRAAEYGNNRIIMGAHYAMDILGGRTTALYVLAHFFAHDENFRATNAARVELQNALDAACKQAGATCSVDTGRFRDPAANAAFYTSTQTYGLPVVYEKTAQTREDFAKISPDAGYLLTAAFPKLTLREADDILTRTEGPGGGFLDSGSEFGAYSRIDLYKAVVAAAATAS
jgi:hypothetical protein